MKSKLVGKTTNYKAGASFKFSSEDESINLILEVTFGSEKVVLCEDCCYHSWRGEFSRMRVTTVELESSDWKDCSRCVKIFVTNKAGVYYQHRRWIHSSGKYNRVSWSRKELESIKILVPTLELIGYSDQDISQVSNYWANFDLNKYADYN